MKTIILTDRQAQQLREIMLDCRAVAYYAALAESVIDQLAEQQDSQSAGDINRTQSGGQS